MRRKPRGWRTNIGLRLTVEDGKAVEEMCEEENRTLANYVETLILQDLRRRRAVRRSCDAHGQERDGEDQA